MNEYLGGGHMVGKCSNFLLFPRDKLDPANLQ